MFSERNIVSLFENTNRVNVKSLKKLIDLSWSKVLAASQVFGLMSIVSKNRDYDFRRKT